MLSNVRIGVLQCRNERVHRCAIVESAAQAMAASRFVQSLAAESGDAELFKQAAALASTARQHELAAWELAAREAQARPKRDAVAAIRERINGKGASNG